MQALGVLDYQTYVIGCVVVVLLPGPNSLYVLSLAAQQGMRRGWAAAFGIFLGDALLMLATALGAVSLLHRWPALFFLIQTVGAAYLAWIGMTLLRSAWINWRDAGQLALAQTHTMPLAPVRARRAFVKALWISLLNPKAMLFFLSFFVQFVDPGYAQPAIPFAVLGVTLQVCSAAYLATLIFAGSRLAERLRARRRLSALGSGSAGTVFLAFAAKLAGASL